MQKIIIIGSSGAGKSTLARQLGQQLSLPIIHLDQLFWNPGWVRTPPAQWQQTLRQLTTQPRWIIDGNYRSTLTSRLQQADTIIFLDLPRWLCLIRAIKRRVQYANRTRPDMAEGCKEYLFDTQFPAFLHWIWDYPNRARPHIVQQLHQFSPHKQIIWLRTPRDVRTFLQTMRQP